MKKKTKSFLKLMVLILFVLLSVFTVWSSLEIETTYYSYSNDKIPQSFKGFKIAHVSDFHNSSFGDEIIEILKDNKPDIIAITGDVIDSYDTKIEVSVNFIKELIEIAPCYFVMGNHEARIEDYDSFKLQIESFGVVVLEDEATETSKNGESISIYGVCDPSFFVDYLEDDNEAQIIEQLNSLKVSENFNILLSHRPEFFEYYVEKEFDLVLSGHAHGGQFRLPLIGGLFAPGQGLFPKYDAGEFEKNGTTMFISRGFTNGAFRIRFNNRPQVIFIEFV